MTITLAGDPVLGKPALRPWCPMLSSQTPAVAMAVPMADRLRLVVLDLVGRDGLEAKLGRWMGRSAAALTATDLADQLAGGHLSRIRCASVAIADLRFDGVLDLQVRAAPPALLLSPGKPARMLSGAPVEAGLPLEPLAAGDVLLLCSASFLENPPPVLGTVRRSPADGEGLAQLRQTLRTSGHQGATASVAVPSLAPRCA